jgi:hypothetical protein
MFCFKVKDKKFYFQLYLSDLVHLNDKYNGDFFNAINEAVTTDNTYAITKMFEDIIETAAIPHFKDDYPELFTKIVTKLAENSKLSSQFINAILPGCAYRAEETIKIEGDMIMPIDQMKEIIFGRSSGRYPWEDVYGKSVRNDNTNCKRNTHARMDSFPPIQRVITHNDRVVIVKFVDGSFTKAVCSPNDKFDIDVGITVCLLKKILGGTNEYNNLIRKIHKQTEQQEAAKKAEKDAKKARREKQAAIKAKRDKGREEASRSFKNDIADAVMYALEAYDKKNAEEDAE